MPKLSRIRLDSSLFGLFLNNFWSAITLLEDKNQAKGFLKGLLTHTEMKMLAKRIQIAKMLLEGYDYRAIRNYVRVTDSTIAAVSNKLETEGEGLRAIVEKLSKIEAEIEKERLSMGHNIKDRYPTYFLPDRIAEGISKSIRKRSKIKSVKKSISL